MHRLKFLQTALLVLPLVALGCGRQRADTRETYGSPAPAASAPAMGSATTLGLGSEVGADGRLASHSDTFKRGEPIIASLDATGVTAGSSLRLTWTGPQGRVVASDEITVPPDARSINFKAQDTTSWSPGQYRVETSGAGAAASSKTFTVE